MIITKNKPYTSQEIEKLRELFDVYIKTVIDIKRKVCSAGCDRHFESEKILQNKILIASLASDLKRIALGIHRKSFIMVDRFSQEAKRWIAEIDEDKLPIYINRLLGNLDKILENKDLEKKKEDALMYSTLFQNYVLYK